MILAQPWTPNFSAKETHTAKAPVWIDLPQLNPALEYYANHMLAKIGKVLYAQTLQRRSQFSHIRRCVL